MSKTIAVVFGGVSNENEISVITGTMAANVLKSGGFTVLPLYISQSGDMFCDEKLCDVTSFKGGDFSRFQRAFFAKGGIYALNKRGKPKKFHRVDVALNCCHGGAEEGGAVSGACKLNKIPLASAGIFESSVFMDKYLTKLILSSLNVKTAEFAYVKSIENLHTRGDMPQFPVIVKPVSLGSSIGVEKAENAEELENAVLSGLIYDSAVIVEEYLEARREINCAAYMSADGVRTSECEEAVSGGDILSFEDKYRGGGKSVLPADIPPDISRLIKDTTRGVYEKLNMRGIVRFDYILSKGQTYLSEINTVPGSLSYYLLSGGFKDFLPVLKDVISRAEKDFAAEAGKKLLRTGILENIAPNTCKTGAK